MTEIPKPLLCRLDRAVEHLEALDCEVREFLDTDPYVATPERDADTGGYTWRVAVREEPPLHLSHIAGDCLHNIRATLDNLAWSLALTMSRTPPPHTSFVIAPDSDTFKNHRWHLDGLPPDAVSIIKGLQPFSTPASGVHGQFEFWGRVGDLVHPDAGTEDWELANRRPLWLLERLWNDDKHRAPILVGAVSQETSIDQSNLTIPPHSTVAFELNIGIIHDGDMIARFIPPEGFQSDAHIELEPAFQIAIDQPKRFAPEPITHLLLHLHDLVRNDFLPRFAKFF